MDEILKVLAALNEDPMFGALIEDPEFDPRVAELSAILEMA